MSPGLDTDVMPPDPPRAVPALFFVRRMQGLLFCGLMFTLADLAALGVAGVVMQGLGASPLPLADLRLDRRHGVATGVIINKAFVSSINNGSQSPWKVTFRFAPDDGPAVQASGFTYDQSLRYRQPGDTLPVEYDPANPSVARPAGGYVSCAPPWVSLIVVAAVAPMFLVGIGILIWIWRAARQERYLLIYGVGVEAEVLRVQPSSSVRFGSHHPYDVYYRFMDHTGQEIVGKDRTYRYLWADALEPGDTVGVVYNPVLPTANVLWLHGSDAPEERTAIAEPAGSEPSDLVRME